ncbi:thiaminase II [SAR202 cluster bacterium AD-802-E10_MRT_200m]|nr:thiaminase II [SAR202 cluster bacterium AD-802-E10_MRT_200m]
MSTKEFSDQLKAEAQVIWEAIFSHPFLEAIQHGTLPKSQFSNYLCQDYHYLEGFARSAALLLARAEDPISLRLLSKRILTPVERSFHSHLFELLNLDLEVVEQVQSKPTNLAYVNHMLVTASLGEGIGEGAAALLPCPWTYHELGKRLPKNSRNPNLPEAFREWIDFYDQGFLTESVRAWRELVDTAAITAGPLQLARMRKAFLTSCYYEFLFWEMAWQEEEWPTLNQ